MRLPNGEVIRHANAPYDPVKAHEYYMRTRKLKGRKKGSAQPTSGTRERAQDREARKREIAARIQALEDKLKELKELIRIKEAALKRSKEAAKPDTAAEKAEKARDAKKYRDKHKQELKAKAKRERDKAGGSGGDKKKDSEKSIKELKELSTKVQGQLAVAKQRLKAL